MNNLCAWLIAGAVLGSAVGMSLLSGGQRHVWKNMLVATVGSALGGWVICPLVGMQAAPNGTFDNLALVVSLISMSIFLAVANLFGDPRS